MAVFQYVRHHKLPVFDDAIVERVGWAHRARESERTKLKLIPSRRFPRAAPTVTVDPRAYTAVGAEGERVLRRIVGGKQRIVTALKPDQLPRRAAEAACCILRRGLRSRTAGDVRQQHRQQQTT